MACKFYKASAPGSLMLMGEHAVLHGFPAIVSAIDKSIHVELKELDEPLLNIDSALGHKTYFLNALAIEKPFQFILGAVIYFLPQIKKGLAITVESEFSHTLGLGSSASITVAMVAVLHRYLNINDREQLFVDARAIMRKVQGRGSGADIAASTFGGTVYYRQKDNTHEQLPHNPLLLLSYCGYKTPTTEVIAHLEKCFENDRDRLNRYYREIAELTEAGRAAIQNKDWKKLGELFSKHRKVMKQMGLETPELTKVIDVLLEIDQVWGAKISGSGLGDCAVAIRGPLCKAYDKIESIIPVMITKKGVKY